MDIDRLKNELLQSRKDLEERLEKIRKHIRHVDTKIEPDFAEQATQRQNDDVINELSESLQHKLTEVRLALKRIDDGNYGICASCGEPVSEKRLTALPHTRYCRDCTDNEGG